MRLKVVQPQKGVIAETFVLCLQNAYVNINRIMSVASRLAEAGHYASTQIKQISAQLDQDWKSFAAALDERSTILAMSSVFHQKAEKVSSQASCGFLGSRSQKEISAVTAGLKEPQSPT